MTKMTSNIKWLQKIIKGIQDIEAPKWYVSFMAEVQKAVWATFLKFTAEEISLIKDKIMEVSKKDIEGEDKFKEVFSYCKAEFTNKKDSVLNSVINNVYLTIKDKM